MPELITLGEKGQIVIPKRIRDELKISKGSRLLLTDDKEKIIIKPVTPSEKHLFMMLSESSLKKVWDNKYDQRWDDVL